MRKTFFIVFTIVCISFCSIFTLSQSGGTFVIQKSVIGGGGGRSSGDIFVLNGITGESLSGTTSSGGAFQVGSGFWGRAAPSTTANITISGRVFTSDGLTGLRNAGVTLTDPVGNVRNATTSSFGFYSFDNVAPGFSYTIRIASRRFRYASQVVVPTADLANVDFVGLE